MNISLASPATTPAERRNWIHGLLDKAQASYTSEMQKAFSPRALELLRQEERVCRAFWLLTGIVVSGLLATGLQVL